MISVIVSWPDSFDFPIFRDRLPLLKKHVDEVIICFNKHGNCGIRDWIKDNVDAVFFDAENSNYPGDWRNKSTKLMIKNAKGDYVLSMEQDFLIKDHDSFFGKVKEKLRGIVMFQEYNERGDRFHPAFLLCEKKLLDSATADFSVMGQGRDHFSYVTQHTLKSHPHTSLESLDLIPERDWFHLQGLTDNYFAPKPYFSLDNFHAYNEACKKIEPMSEYWVGQMDRCSGEFNDPKCGGFL